MKRTIQTIVFVLLFTFAFAYPVAAQGEVPPVESFEVTNVVVIGLVLAFLSLLIDYAPKIAPWFDALPLAKKRQLILGLCFVVVAGLTGLDCAGVLGTSIQCSPFNWQSLAELAFSLVASVAGMTAFHNGSKPIK